MARTPVRQAPSQRPPHRHDHTAQAEVLLRERGLKVTTPRLLVLKALLDQHRPTSAQELLESLSEHGLDQVTVYRTISTLVEIDIAQPVSTTDGSRRFEVHVCDGCRVDHPHLQCRRCGDMDCLEEGVLPAPLIPTRLAGYLIDEAKLYLFGLCPRCQRLEKEAEKGPEKQETVDKDSAPASTKAPVKSAAKIRIKRPRSTTKAPRPKRT